MSAEKNMASARNNFYDSNMELLKKFHYRTFKVIDNFEISDKIEEPFKSEIFYTSEGKANLKVNLKNGTSVFLHDKIDPEKEIPQFLNMIPVNANGVVLLTGMGLCYTPIAILEKRKNIQYLAVFDLIPEIFVQALKYMDLSSMLSDPRLILSIGSDPEINKVLAPASLALQLESIYDLKHLPSFAIDNEKYAKLSDDVFTIANQFNLGGGAILGGGRVYTANRFENLTSMYKNSMIENLKGKFKNIPAVLVAGGPSLNLNIHLLKKLKGRAVIIAVDSTLPALVAKGVSPDFLTAIDPYDLIYEKFADALPQTQGTSLITSAWVAPKVAKAFPALEIFWTFSGRNMENWMQEMMGGKIPTGGASTVAHLNLAAAILMGCSPIVFIGQDLAYTGQASHAENTVLTQNQAMQNLLKSRDLLWTDEISGGKVPTDRKFLNFKRHFEDLMAANPGVYINSTVMGASIKGTEPMSLEEVIEKYCTCDKQIQEIISSAISSEKTSEKFLNEFRGFLRKSRTLLKIIKKSDLLHEHVIKILKNDKNKNKKLRSFNSLPGNLKVKINEIDQCHKKIDGYKKIWGVLDEITMEGLKQSERFKHDIEKLKNNPERYTDWLLKNLERLKHINKVRKNELSVFETNISRLVQHFEKEKTILKVLEKLRDKNNEQKTESKDVLLQLAQLYFDNSDFSLLGNVCSEFENINTNSDRTSAEISFYAGCVYLLRNYFDDAEKCFIKAIDHAPDLKIKIDDFRTRLGDKYVGHADFFNGKDDNTIRRMLIKGLKYSGGHRLLEKRLNEMADALLRSSSALFEKPESSSAADPDNVQNSGHLKNSDKSGRIKQIQIQLKKWIDDIEANMFLNDILTGKKTGEFYRLYGSLLVKENKSAEAVKFFDKSLCFIKNNPEYYLFKADACFSINDYDNGIKALQKAVALDVKFAGYWENMGDNLAAQGRFNDAVAAYEQFYAASMENKMVLKKISKCFVELGQFQAAKDTLLKLKTLCQ